MGSASQTGKSALIFGASGVTGWAFVNEILHDYPEDGIWTKVHALTNRPLSQKDSLWPADPRLNIVSGIDLLEGNQEDLESTIKTKITGIEGVTHMYYLGRSTNTIKFEVVLIQYSVQGRHRRSERARRSCKHVSESDHSDRSSVPKAGIRGLANRC